MLLKFLFAKWISLFYINRQVQKEEEEAKYIARIDMEISDLIKKKSVENIELKEKLKKFVRFVVYIILRLGILKKM